MSLKTKMALVVSLVVTGLLSIMALYSLKHFEQVLRTTISGQQNTMVAAIADDIDSKLRLTQNALLAAAVNLPPETLAQPERAQRYLEDRFTLAALFDNALFIFSEDGRLVAESPFIKGRRGKDFAFRDYFKNTVLTGKPQISSPYISSRNHRHPTVMLTAPIFDNRGKFKGILAGSFNLLGDNILGNLRTIKVGKTGYLYLYDTNRTMIIHPESKRILTQDFPPGANKLLDQAIAGFEGTGETVTSTGLHTLSTFKRLKSTNWILAANYPEVEAYAPIYSGKRYLLMGLGIMLVISIFLVWYFMGYLTAPLLLFTRHVQELSGKIGDLSMLKISTGDEIGALAKSFNLMISNMAAHEKNLREQLHFSDSLVQGSAVPTFVLDAQHRVLAWNKACEELTGIAAVNFMGTDRHWQAFYNHRRPCLADIVLVGNTHEPQGLYTHYGRSTMITDGLAAEGWFLGLNGMDRYLVFNAAPIKDIEGRVIAAIETLEDITERKRIEEQLNRMSQAIEQSPSTVLITDTDGKIEYVNPKFMTLTGYSAKEVLGHNPRILKSGETPPECYRELWETISNGHEWRGEFHNCKKNGELYWESASISPLRNTEGEITHYIAIKEDITEKKQMEAQLRHSQKMEAIGTLAGGIAQDFNNSLTAIIGYGNLINNKLEDGHPVRHYAQQIIATAETTASLTQGLLSYSRKRHVNPQSLDLNQLVHRVGQLLRQLMGEEINQTISLTDTALPVQADSGQLEQILMSLAMHGHDAMNGKGELAISTTIVVLDEEFIACRGFGKKGNYAMLTVGDSGPGLDNTSKERLFEPFFSPGEEIGKNGMGLSVTYGMIKQHNGFIDVVSTPGQGTTFKVYLPLAD